MGVDLRSLIGRLNDRTRGTVEAAAGLCLSRTHYDVEVEHAIKGLTSMIEPMLTVVLGGAVVIMAFGIFLPMWDLVGAIK